MLRAEDGGRPKTPQTVFDRVAPYYDTLNSILSLGIDRRWRRRAIRSLNLQPGERVLDVATGTGALACEIVRATSGTVSVTGCDLNERMLSVAKQRTSRAGAKLSIDFICCDAQHLPFGRESFDAVTIAFAIDDMVDRQACIGEIWRVLRSPGRFALLELGQPDEQPAKAAYHAYLKTFRVFGRGYRHLEQEILKYRGAGAIRTLLTGVGFTGYACESLTWGIARLHTAEKPGPAGR